MPNFGNPKGVARCRRDGVLTAYLLMWRTSVRTPLAVAQQHVTLVPLTRNLTLDVLRVLQVPLESLSALSWT